MAHLLVTMMFVRLCLILMEGAAATSAWSDLGAGGCRETGGRYEKHEVLKGIADAAACREACESDDACTATVFGIRSGQTFCHLLSGGPYTHTDQGMSGFVCQVRSLNCTTPDVREAMNLGYDVSSCAGASAGSVPECNIKCAIGYSGTPVARCLRDGGEFTMQGCARLSLDWQYHGGRTCSALGSPHSSASETAVSLVACMASCQENDNCAAITYESVTARCDIFHRTPSASTALAKDESAPSTRECWRLGPATTVDDWRESVGADSKSASSALPGRAAKGDEELMIPAHTAPLLFVGGLFTGICAVTAVVCFMRRRPEMPSDVEQGGCAVVDPVDVEAAKGFSADAAVQNAASGTTFVEPFKPIVDDVDVEKIKAMRAGAAPSGSPRSYGSTSTRASTPPVPGDPLGAAATSVPEPPQQLRSPTYAWIEPTPPSRETPPLRESRTRLPPLVDAPHRGRALPTVSMDAAAPRLRGLGSLAH